MSATGFGFSFIFRSKFFLLMCSFLRSNRHNLACAKSDEMKKRQQLGKHSMYSVFFCFFHLFRVFSGYMQRCQTFSHKISSNDDLAKNSYSVTVQMSMSIVFSLMFFLVWKVFQLTILNIIWFAASVHMYTQCINCLNAYQALCWFILGIVYFHLRNRFWD